MLLCEGGDVGRAAIWNSDDPIMIQNHLHKLRPIKDVIVKYYYYVIFTAKHISVFSDAANGVGLRGLSSSALHNVRLTMPSLQEQQAIADYLDTYCAKVDATVSEIKAQIADLKLYKQSLISEAVTGKICVTD